MFCDANDWFLNELNFFVLKSFLFLSLCFIQWYLMVCYGENDFK